MALNSFKVFKKGHVLWKFRIYATRLALRFSKMKKKWLRKCMSRKKVHIIVISEFCPFLEGGWQLEASFSQSFLLQFWKCQCPSCSKHPEFSKTAPTCPFLKDLNLVKAIFPLITFFLVHPVNKVWMALMPN